MFRRAGAIFALVGSLLVPASNAHMIMAQPVPFGVNTLNNSPLEHDYPCKQRAGAYDISTMNNMEVGKPQTLSFSGTAIHGGGSCQLSVSLDKNPTPASTFKVIHTIEGDCPGANAAESFQFKIPEGFPNGEFALAWTWFNKIGNREMYMNCAPITVTGGADNNDVYDKLPDMQVANIPSTTCKTVDGSVPIFPDPGDSLDHRGNGPFEKMLGDCGTPTQTGPSMGNANKPGKSSGAAAPQPVPTHACDPCALPSFITSVIPSASETSVATATASPTLAPAPVDTPAPDSNSTAGSTCGEDGTMVCNGPNQFGICNFGKVIWQDVAPGTQCKNGQITSTKKARVVRRRLADRANYNYNYNDTSV